jgi:hypothetical protein
MAKAVENAQYLVAALFLVMCLMVAIFDLYATRAWGSESTVSWIVRNWSAHYPILPFMLGMLAGHLFWVK